LPDTGGGFSPARLALAAKSERELIIIIIISIMFLNYLRNNLIKLNSLRIIILLFLKY
jgi:hypothetical protein